MVLSLGRRHRCSAWFGLKCNQVEIEEEERFEEFQQELKPWTLICLVKREVWQVKGGTTYVIYRQCLLPLCILERFHLRHSDIDHWPKSGITCSCSGLIGSKSAVDLPTWLASPYRRGPSSSKVVSTCQSVSKCSNASLIFFCSSDSTGSLCQDPLLLP